MPFEQRYTPVPGMGPASNRYSQALSSGSGNRLSQDLGGTDESYGGNYAQGSNVFTDGPLPALPTSSRAPYSDYFRSDERPTQLQPNRWSSDLSTKSALGAGAGAGGAALGGGAQRMSMASTAQSATFHNPQAYQNVPSEQYWDSADGALQPAEAAALTLDQAQERRDQKAHRRKGLIIGIVIGVLALAGVIAGITVSQTRKHHDNSSALDSTAGGASNDNGTTTNGTSTGTASQYTKDPRLHQSFYGFAYTPTGAVPPYCGSTLDNVTAEVWIMSQLTTRLRLYSANCNTTALVLQAIEDLGVNMTIWPAVYVDSNDTAMTTQLQALGAALETYGTDHIGGITIGNEYILDITGTSDNSSSGYASALATLQADLKTANTTIKNLKLDKPLPIGNSDSGANFGTALGKSVDFWMSNVHPYFAAQSIDAAAQWTWDFFQSFDQDVADSIPNHPEMYIAETGWPTASDKNNALPNDGFAGTKGDASVANLQTYLDTFVCQSNKNGLKYFYFEAFDEPWKAAEYGATEAHWGLFDSSRNLKTGITIPQC